MAITAKGSAVLADTVKAWRGVQGEVASDFGPARLQALVSELAAFTEAARG